MARHPFQCIATVRAPLDEAKVQGFLLAACGPKLVSLDIANGTLVSESMHVEMDAAQNGHGTHTDEGEPPAKKQKKAQAPSSEPNVIKLAVSPDQQHAVAVTDDKCVRVFSVSEKGKLSELSQRYMPKRPCAIQILSDNSTILCGDKFGDVYSLPLLPQESNGSHNTTIGAEKDVPGKGVEPKPVDFKPSATNLTVHTQRNRKALESQLKQKDFAMRKEPLKFEHKLLLGHVSMLTDLTFATQSVEGKERRYIITADRDEHIRISRAPPQSHVIEGFCLGHTEFISKICLVPGTNLLLSAGGDDWIGVWEWPTFELRKKVHLSYEDRGGLRTDTSTALSSRQRTAVSGLWVVPLAEDDNDSDQAVLVACERLPILFMLPVGQLRSSSKSETAHIITDTEGPVLDIAVSQRSFIVSTDPMFMGSRSSGADRLRGYSINHSVGTGAFQVTSGLEVLLSSMNQIPSEDVDDKKLDEFLYTVASMRKRRDWEQGEEKGDEDDE